MRHASWFVCLVGVLASAAGAEDQIHWQPNLEAAERLAAKTNRLVLIHFWAPWCGPCMNMERTVFAQPEVGPALEPNFVMVKLNADDAQAVARIYQVMTLPTDVIVTPSGRMITSMPSSSKPQQYVAQLNQAAATYQAGSPRFKRGQRPRCSFAKPLRHGSGVVASRRSANRSKRGEPPGAAIRPCRDRRGPLWPHHSRLPPRVRR